MKKLYAIFSILILVLFISSIDVRAYSYGNVSTPKGNNLIDPDNVEIYDEGSDYYLYNPNPIYINKKNSKVTIMIESDYIDQSDNPSLEMEVCYYDYDLLDLDCDYVTLSDSDVSVSYKNVNYNYRYVTFTPCVEEVVFIQISSLRCDVSLKEATSESVLMVIGELPSSVDEYESIEGFKELTDSVAINIYTSYDTPLSTDKIKSFFVAEDAYKGIVTDTLSVTLGNYETKSDKLGKYTLVISATDGENKTNRNVILNVVDKKAPVISGGPFISYVIGETITNENILSNFTAQDGYDGDLTSSIQLKGTYEATPSVVKSQTVNLEVSDLSGNKATKEITLLSIDTTPPTITGDEIIYISYDLGYTRDKLIKEYYTITDDQDENPVIEFYSDTYTLNRRKLGTWKLGFRVKDASGNKTEKTIYIVVTDQIPPVIYLDTYKVSASTEVKLKEDDFVKLLKESGILDSNKKYSVKVLNTNYIGHESEEGIYDYEALFTSEDGEVLSKAFKITVLSSNEVIDEKTILSKKENTTIAIVGGVLMTSILLSSMLISVFKKKKLNNK